MLRTTALASILALAPLGTAMAESAGQADPAVLSSLVNPGRPHGQHDPHGRLTPDKLIQVALQHRAEGRPQEALQTLTQALMRHPREASLYAVRGSLNLERGHVTAALSDLESALRITPDDASALVNRAQVYRRFDRRAEALADLDRAVELAPNLLAARFNRGAMRFDQGKADLALADFDHCVAVNPHSAAPYFNRAAVYDALGRHAEAQADIRRFLELTDNEAWRKAGEDLLEAWQEQAEARAEQGRGAS